MGPPTQEHTVRWQSWGEPRLWDSLPEEAALGRRRAHPRSRFTEPTGGPPQAHWARPLTRGFGGTVFFLNSPGLHRRPSAKQAASNGAAQGA